jgi:ribosomal-protein-alanine N-acetyltransferase
MIDEAHITTIAVDPAFRRRGIGELLMVQMAKLAVLAGAVRMTLEVRMSNQPAQALYRKYGFTEGGVRPRYYSDDFEDALIMHVENIADNVFGERVEVGEQELRRRLSWKSEL